AADVNALLRKLDTNARRPIGALRGRMCGSDLREQLGVVLRTPRWRSLRPRIVAAGGDTQEPTHGGDRIGGLVSAHESVSRGGIPLVSRANQAVAFDRISRSNRSCRFSRRSRLSSSRSSGVRLSPPPSRLALPPRLAHATQLRIDVAVGPNSCASSVAERPA